MQYLFSHRHEQSSRHSLTRDVGNREREMIGVEQNKIVKVPADHPRGLDRREDLEVAAIGWTREMPREQAKLNRARGIQLAVEPRFDFALVLQLVREPAASSLCDAQI